MHFFFSMHILTLRIACQSPAIRLGWRSKRGSCVNIQWGKKVFSHPPIVQVLPLKKMREACNFHHRYTSTMTDKNEGKNPENDIVGFLMNLFANYGGK